jgi:hypothetical protein
MKINLPDFKIVSAANISSAFKKNNIHSFAGAVEFIRDLPYKRNSDKNDLTTVFSDNCGTCSTKHAILKKLADENNFQGVELMLGVFRMNKINTPKVSETLLQNDLEYIPEAHNYLRFEDQVWDFTARSWISAGFLSDLLEEIVIEPEQITDFKVAYHKEYLNKWLSENAEISYSLHEIWQIKEQCIRDLSK